MPFVDLNTIIIENVMKYDCLFNFGAKDYKNVRKKEEIWERIGKLVNLPGEGCRKRWKSLRDTYIRRKRASQLASQNGDPSPAKKWKYMDMLEFLDECKDARAKNGSVEDIYSEVERQLDCSNLTSSTVHNDGGSDESGALTKAQPKKYTKKHANAEITSGFKEVMQECANSIQEIASQKESIPNSTLLFFESLARKISDSNAPESVVSRIEAQVMNLVYEEIAAHSTSHTTRTRERTLENASVMFFKSLQLDYDTLSTKRQRTFRLAILRKIVELQEEDENEAATNNMSCKDSQD